MSLLLDDLLERCTAFDEELQALLEDAPYIRSAKSTLINTMCDLAVEHGRSLRLLVAHGNLVSALALLRVQLDATLRFIWIHYAASDEWAMEALTPRPGVTPKDPTHDLTAKQMLLDLATSAPPELHRQLAEFKQAAWPALNSFVHSGIWPILQRYAGNEVEGSIQTLRNSSGLTGMAAMMVAMYTGDAQNTIAVKLIQLKHRHCLPPLIDRPGFEAAGPALSA